MEASHSLLSFVLKGHRQGPESPASFPHQDARQAAFPLQKDTPHTEGGRKGSLPLPLFVPEQEAGTCRVDLDPGAVADLQMGQRQLVSHLTGDQVFLIYSVLGLKRGTSGRSHSFPYAEGWKEKQVLQGGDWAGRSSQIFLETWELGEQGASEAGTTLFQSQF